jgi:hypothetical protein
VSKLGNWKEPNWYWDQKLPKKEILRIIRQNWKALKKGENMRRKAAREDEKDFNLRPDYYINYNRYFIPRTN